MEKKHRPAVSALQPRVTDFGLAKKLEVDSSLTGTGQVLGTPSYMAPEQVKGDLAQIGPATDVYALGAVLYCTLIGRPPFEAATPMETMVRVLHDEPLAPRKINHSVPRDLDTICLKCLEKDIAKRYQTCQYVSEELERYIRGEPILARPIPARERAVKWARRNPTVAAAVTITALALVFGLVGSVIFNVKLQNEKTEKSILSFRLTKRLGESLVQQARAERLLGNRTRSFELIHDARRLGTVPDLRTEALQTFAIPEITLQHSLTMGHVNWIGLDDQRKLAAAHGYSESVPGTWIKIWDIPTGDLVAEEQILENTHSDRIGGRIEPFDWGEKTIHFGEYNHPVLPEHSYPGLPQGLIFVAESNGGNLAALWNPIESDTSHSTHSDGWIEIWDLKTGRLRHRLSRIRWPWAAFSPDDSMLAVQGAIGSHMTVRVWELSSQRLIGEMIDNHWPKWDQQGRHLVTVGPSSDHSYTNVSTSSFTLSEGAVTVPVFQSAVNVWRVTNLVPSYTTMQPIEMVHFGSAQQVAINASIFEISTEDSQYRLQSRDLLEDQRFTAVFRKGQPWRFQGATQWTVIDRKAVRVDRQNEFHSVDEPNAKVIVPDPQRNPKQESADGMVHVPKNEFVRVCQPADTVVLVGRDRWMRQDVFEEGPYGPNGYGFEYHNPDAGAYYFDIWSISDFQRLRTIWLKSDDPRPVVISTDGRSAIIRNEAIFDLQTSHTDRLPPQLINVCASWMNSSEVIVGTKDGKVYCLDRRRNLQLLNRWQSSQQAVSAIDSNGQELLVGDENGAITWYSNKREIAHWPAHRDAVSSIRISPEGAYFISGTQSGMIKIWPIKLMREQLRDLGLIRR